MEAPSTLTAFLCFAGAYAPGGTLQTIDRRLCSRSRDLYLIQHQNLSPRDYNILRVYHGGTENGCHVVLD